MNPLISTIIGGFFLFSGAVAVYTMMSKLGRHQISNPERYRTFHHVTGWIFVILFVIMFVFMLARIEHFWEESSPRITVHISLAMALLVLLSIKVTIPRFFPNLGKHLFLLGITVYLASFTLVGITAGYYIVRKIERMPYISHSELPEHMLDEKLGKELFITKCSTCHILENIMNPRSVESWEKVINDMIILAEPRITRHEASQILHYLSLTHVPQSFEVSEEATPIEKHCLPCHELKDIYGQRFSQSGWRSIVEKMNEYDSEIVPEEKINEIVDFLVKE